MQFNHSNGHLVQVDGRSMLFHVPTSALFELDELGAAVVDCVQREPHCDPESQLAGRFTAGEIAEFVDQLARLEVLQSPGALRPINPVPVNVASYPLSTIVLNVNTGCNLGCTYCYKED